MQFRTAFQINAGLGAGNIGDDLMNRAFWQHLPDDFVLHAGVFENYAQQREPYPDRINLHVHTPGDIENGWVEDMPGILAGAGCIFDRPGEGWPLAFLAPRLQHFHDRGLPVDAVGVTAEALTTDDGRRLFRDYLLPIRSWSVCDSTSAEVLVELGVDPLRIVLGADWAWLYESPVSNNEWAIATWTALGVDLSLPLLVVNVFWSLSIDAHAMASQFATALDSLHQSDGFQIAFVCADFRHPGFHQSGAELVQSLMTAPSILVPNAFYGPGELLALLSHASAVVSSSHVCGMAAILTGTIPVFLASRPKGEERCESFGWTPYGKYDSMDPEALAAVVRAGIINRENILTALARTRSEQAARARHNLDLFALFHGLPSSSTLYPEESGFP